MCQENGDLGKEIHLMRIFKIACYGFRRQNFFIFPKKISGVPVVAQWVKNAT